MSDKNQTVGFKEAREQVKVTAVRLALMHLAYAHTLVDELGEEKGKKLVRKAMMEYGRLVGERNKAGGQDLPYYGLHESYEYRNRKHLDSRDYGNEAGDRWDWGEFKVHGCVLSQVFKEYGEEELGRLYCYVDAAKSMAADPDHKLVHTSCEVCGDDHCAFDLLKSTEDEKKAFTAQDDKWSEVDPLLSK